MFLQVIQFTSPQPPQWNLPTVRIVPCGPDEDQKITIDELTEQGILSSQISQNKSRVTAIATVIATKQCKPPQAI